MTIKLHRLVEKEINPRSKNSTRLVRIRAKNWDGSLYPVIMTLGWPDSALAGPYLAGVPDAFVNAILASGYTIYAPFTGSNWGHASNIYPTGTGGTGYTAITDAIAAAADDGLDASKAHLLGMSMGGCNVFNWAWRNTSNVSSIYAVIPCVDLVGSYDCLAAAPWNSNPATMNGAPSMLNVYSAANRAALVTNCSSNDPSRNTSSLTSLGSKTKVFSVATDEVIPAASLATFCNTIGASQYVQATGSHFFPTLWADFDEYTIPAWFQAHS